jgi:penicillin-binding protein 2
LEQVGGKTGTTKGTDTRDPTALFVGVAPVDDPRYVVVLVVEEGGNGGRVAAPGVRRILQSLVGNIPTELVPGEESD